MIKHQLAPVHPHQLLLWGGVVLPGVVPGALVASALALGERLLPAGSAIEPLRIEVTARQWAWEFRYPDHGSKTYGRLHIPVRRDIHFIVTSADVIHSFWIPRLGGKIDAIPGQSNVIRLRADRAGIYEGICAEYCGQGHASMMFTVEAHEDAGFETHMSALAIASRERPNAAAQNEARNMSQARP